MNQEKAKQISRTMKAMAQKNSLLNINVLRIIVALERAIARLLHSKALAEHLIFKGGFVLLKNYKSPRFTRDADALALAIPKEKLKDLVGSALNVDLEDGLWFGDIQVKELTEQGEYGSYRFDCAFQIGLPDPKKIHKLSRVHIDVNFSDRLPTKPANQVMPSVLEHEEPVIWKIYPIEYIVAEKIQTFFDRGSANSRAKDIYDLIYLFPRCSFAKVLAVAIKTTFENRKTAIPESFAEQAGQFDKTILSRAWPSVEILENRPEFNEAWDALMKYLEKMDQFKQKT